MKTKRRLVLFVALILLAVLFFNLRQEKHTPAPVLSALDHLIMRLVRPVHEGLTSSGNFFSGLWNRYGNLVGARQENETLKEQLAKTELLVLSLKERLRLKDEEFMNMGFVREQGWSGVPAHVIGFDPYADSKTIWVSAGSDAGVKVDQPVVTSKGLVGKVVKASPTSAQILLLIDSRFAVDVIDIETRVRALLVGMGRKMELKRYPFITQLEYLRLGDPVNAGDLLMTSGLGGIYPKGIPVGNVIELPKKEGDALFQSAPVLPAVDVASLENVVILTGGLP